MPEPCFAPAPSSRCMHLFLLLLYHLCIPCLSMLSCCHSACTLSFVVHAPFLIVLYPTFAALHCNQLLCFCLHPVFIGACTLFPLCFITLLTTVTCCYSGSALFCQMTAPCFLPSLVSQCMVPFSCFLYLTHSSCPVSGCESGCTKTAHCTMPLYFWSWPGLHLPRAPRAGNLLIVLFKACCEINYLQQDKE